MPRRTKVTKSFWDGKKHVVTFFTRRRKPREVKFTTWYGDRVSFFSKQPRKRALADFKDPKMGMRFLKDGDPPWSMKKEQLTQEDWVIRIYGQPIPLMHLLNTLILISLIGLCYNLGVFTQLEQQKMIAYNCGLKQPNGVYWVCSPKLDASNQVVFACRNQSTDPRDADMNRLLNLSSQSNP